VEAREPPRLPLDRHRVRRADPGRVVLVHRSTHRAARARRPQRGRGPLGHDLRRVPEDPPGVHFRVAGDHRRRAVRRRPGRRRRHRLPGARDPAASGGVQGTRPRRDAGRADELPRLRVQLLLDPAHLGRVSQAAARRERGAARGGGPPDHGGARGAGPRVDSVHEIRLPAALHLLAECAGLHRPADCRVLSAGGVVSAPERRGRAGGSVDWSRARDGAARARARAGPPPARHFVGVVRDRELPAFRGDPRGRGPRDRAARARACGGAHGGRRPLGGGRPRRGGDGAAAAQRGAVGGARGDAWRVVDRVRLSAAALALLAACRAAAPVPAPAPVAAVGVARAYDPARDLGALFPDVQLAGLFRDSKTFVDARPLLDPADIAARYAAARTAPGFSLAAFVHRYFALPPSPVDTFRADTAQTMEAHLRALWPVLTRAPPPDSGALSSLLPLPRPYVVPGGRFREIYYWDSYFTMLGLVASDRVDLVRDMLDNFAYLVRR